MAAARRRTVLLFVLALAAVAADAGDPPPQIPGATPGFVTQESESGPLLLGRVDATAILAAFPDWPQDLEAWQPDAALVADLEAVTTPTEVLCILGTWCGDSQREVPRFWHLLDAAANPHLRLDMVAVGRADDVAARRTLADLGFGDDLRAALGIEKVPTFIFRQAGMEIGRIVESPVVSLEADAAAILRGAGWR